MKNRVASLAAAVLLAVSALPAAAFGWTPIQIGFAGSSFQLFPEDTDVMGLRLNLPASRNENVTGIDVGIVSIGDDIQALRFNLFNGSDYHFSGLEVGIINHDRAVSGLAVGLINSVEGDVSGMQIGAFNHAGVMTGMQIGVFNHAVTLRGLQIGLVNIVDDGPITFFPILNMAF